MSQAYISAVDTHPDLKHAHIVHDPFHVIKRALEALDELHHPSALIPT